MLRWKEKLTLKNWSAENIAVLCWCGTILAGAIIRLVCNKVSFKNLPEDGVGFAVLFLIQLVVAIIIGKCYTETPSAIHRKILLALGVLHGILMLGDISLLIWLTGISLWGCFILSVTLFLLTGIYLMILRKRWQGIVVALFSLIAWIQPGILWASQQ